MHQVNFLSCLIQFYKYTSFMNTSIQLVPFQDSSIQAEEILPPSVQTNEQVMAIAHHQLPSLLNQKCDKNTKKNTYNWNRVQNAKYVKFLKKHAALFSLSIQERKCIKINIMMSQMVQTRSAAQCRSHHQKMLSKFVNIANIIRVYEHLSPKKPKKSEQIIVSQEVLKENQSYEQSMLKNGENSFIHVGRTPPFWLKYADVYQSFEASFRPFDISQS